jgi:hypothetical protein
MGLKFIALLSLFGFAAAAVAHAQTAQPSPYAADECKSGCYVARAGAAFYKGAMPQSYRVCPIDSFDAKVSVDGVIVPVAGIRFGVRACVDVNGRELMALEQNVAVGKLPN